ncbi:hypothetical protein EBZ39_08470, partial [bacterium]|nr:hypothetical protein [bacterium]
KVGFCFTGDGARGAVQAGIAFSLAYHQQIWANFVTGVSSGSVCAAAYSHLGPAGCAELWAGIKSIFSVFQPNWWIFGKTGLMNQCPMEKLVYRAVQNHPHCESVVTRLNIATGDLQYVSNFKVSRHDFAEAVLGSVAITGLVQDRNGWIDAGSRQLAPVSLCVDAGCTDIYVIAGRPLHQIAQWKKPRGILPAIPTALRALDLTLFEITLRDINYWTGPDAPESAKDINIYLIQPTDLFYDNVDFRCCASGVKLGMYNYTGRNKEELRMHFQRYPLKQAVRR